MKQINRYFERHPIQAIGLGWLLLIAITLAVIPDNDAQVNAVLHQRGAT
jgi:hypothetical protein